MRKDKMFRPREAQLRWPHGGSSRILEMPPPHAHAALETPPQAQGPTEPSALQGGRWRGSLERRSLTRSKISVSLWCVCPPRHLPKRRGAVSPHGSGHAGSRQRVPDGETLKQLTLALVTDKGWSHHTGVQQEEVILLQQEKEMSH